MTLRTFFVALGFVGLASALAACNAPASETASSAAAESAPSPTAGVDLDAVVVKGSVAVGDAVTVSYDPNDYPEATAREVPYIAVRLVPRDRTAAESVSIHVEGQFPGSPSVLVLDQSDAVVASGKGIAGAGVAHADVEVAAAARPLMVLVRDDHWVRPMPFTVSAQ